MRGARLKARLVANGRGWPMYEVLWLTGNHYHPSEEGFAMMAAAGNDLQELPKGVFSPLPNLQARPKAS